MPEVVEVMQIPEVKRIHADLCMYGMLSWDDGGRCPLQKAHGGSHKLYVHGAPALYQMQWQTQTCCSAWGGKATYAEVYPNNLCAAILRGIVDQLKEDVKFDAHGQLYPVCSEAQLDVEYFDDVTGLKLDSAAVQKARSEEIAGFHKHGVYEKVPLQDTWDVTGNAPVGVGWLDINKGDVGHPGHRSRLVAKEVKRTKEEEMLAAPPLEAKKALCSLATTGTQNSSRPLKLLFIDVKRAYFFAPAKRPVYVQLPDEDATTGMCGRLKKSMYGTRDAASNWEECYSQRLGQYGFKAGLTSPCIMYHEERSIRLVVHGDDFTFLCHHEDLCWVEKIMSQLFDINIRRRRRQILPNIVHACEQRLQRYQQGSGHPQGRLQVHSTCCW